MPWGWPIWAGLTAEGFGWGAWLPGRGCGLVTPPRKRLEKRHFRRRRHAARRSLGPLPAAPRGPARPGPARPRHGASAGSAGARGERGGSGSGRGVPGGVTLPPADAAVPAGDRRRLRRHVRRVPGPRRLGAGAPGGLQEAGVNRGPHRNRDQERDQEGDQERDQRPRAGQAPRPNKGR